MQVRYFDHDTTAASDDLIMALRIEHGGAAVDCYWALLEKIHKDEAPLNLFGTDGETNAETKSVSHRLCIGSDELKTYVSAMLGLGLFEGTVENLTSRRAEKNIEAYQRKAETARHNGKSGGRKPKRKPKGNQVGSDVATDAATNVGARKEKKGIGSDKRNQIPSASGDADAGEPAPPAAVECPTCGVEMEPTNSFSSGRRRRVFRCPLCGDTAEVAVS